MTSEQDMTPNATHQHNLHCLDTAKSNFQTHFYNLKTWQWSAVAAFDEEMGMTHASFDIVLVNVTRCLSSWSTQQRRRANQLNQGGLIPGEKDKQELKEIQVRAVSCTNELYELLNLIDNSQLPPALKSNYRDKTSACLRELAKATLLVTYLSDQILKKSKMFIVKVQLLVANAFRQHDASFSLSVQYSLVSEGEARELLTDVHRPGESLASPSLQTAREKKTKQLAQRGRKRPLHDSAENDCLAGKWTFSLKHNQTPNSFPKVNSDAVARDDSTSDDELNDARSPITSYKSTVMFNVKLVMLNGESNLRTCSPPVVLITHVKQQCASWCTLFWDNAFSSDSREQFEVPREVSRARVLDSLIQWFNRTGRMLDDDQKAFLARCLPESVTLDSLNCVNTDAGMQMIKLPFWQWFYQYATFICGDPQIQEFWKNGWIRGFISVADAAEKLRRTGSGTALIRFSTACKNAAVSVLKLSQDQSKASDKQKILKYGPWRAEDLAKLDFHIILRDLNIFVLEPNTNWVAELGHKQDWMRKRLPSKPESDDEGVECIATRLQIVPCV